MNYEDNSQPTHIDTVTPPAAPTPPPDPTPAPAAVKQPRRGMKVALTAALGLVVVVLVIGAYYLGTLAPQNKATDNAATKTSEATAPASTSEKTKDADTAAIAESYDGWQEYTNPVYGYSFKHPAEWPISRKVVQDPADWVSIDLPGEKNPGSHDIIAFHTYLDGTGCGKTVERQFTVGDEVMTGESQCGDPHYTITTKDSSGKRVAITIDTAQGNDDSTALLLKSVTGLTAVK